MLRLNNRYCCIIDWEFAFINSVNLIKNLFQLCVKKKLSSFQLIRIFLKWRSCIVAKRRSCASGSGHLEYKIGAHDDVCGLGTGVRSD